MRRDKGLIILSISLTCLWVSSVSGGYRDLRDTLNRYQPPAYLFETEDAAQIQKPSEEQEVDPFTVEKNHILALKERWEKVLRSPPEETAFYRPNPQILKALDANGANPTVSRDILMGSFSLEILGTLTLLRNPGVKAAEKQVKATLEQFGQMTTVDDILRQFTAFTEDLMTGIGPMKGKEAVTMKFPFPGVLALKGQVVAQDVLAASENLETARRNAVTVARKSHWRLWFLHQAQAITAKTVVLLNQLESVANTRFEAGKTSFQDAIKIRVKREILEEELMTLREKQRNTEAQIREILYLSPDSRVGMPQVSHSEVTVPALESLYDTALTSRQELRRLRARIGKMERMIEMAETMILPSLSLGFSLYQDDAITQAGSMSKQPTFATSVTASTGAGLPKQPWFGTADAYLRETRQKRQALREELKQAEAATITLVHMKWLALDQARRERRLYQHTVSPLSQAALEVSSSGYESGTVSFADVIASYTLWLDANLALANQRSAYGISLAELEQAVGRSFSQHR